MGVYLLNDATIMQKTKTNSLGYLFLWTAMHWLMSNQYQIKKNQFRFKATLLNIILTLHTHPTKSLSFPVWPSTDHQTHLCWACFMSTNIMREKQERRSLFGKRGWLLSHRSLLPLFRLKASYARSAFRHTLHCQAMYAFQETMLRAAITTTPTITHLQAQSF